MSDLKTSSGPYDVYASGTVLSYEMHEISIELHESFKLTVRVEFETDAEENMDFQLPQPNHLVIVVRNPSSVGFGLRAPSHVGTLKGRMAYLVSRIDTFGHPATSFRLDYTVFMGASV